MSTRWYALAIPLLAFGMAGCRTKEPNGATKAVVAADTPLLTAAEAPAAAPPPEAVKEADEIFAARCTTCHGAKGRGDGPSAATLSPKPRNYSDKDWQKSVTDAQIEKIIVVGGAAVGKSVIMPPNPDLADKPQVVAALRQKIREFGK